MSAAVNYPRHSHSPLLFTCKKSRLCTFFRGIWGSGLPSFQLAPSLSINLFLLYTSTFQSIGHMDFELETFHSHKHLENTHLYFLTINSNHCNLLLALISTLSPSSVPCPFYFLHMVHSFASPPYWFSCLVFFLTVVPSSILYTINTCSCLSPEWLS